MPIKKLSKTIIVIICLLAASFYFYETILETIPSIIVNDLMQSFHINATSAGILDVCYFTTYAIMQIPGGILLDRLGARKVMPLAALACFIGLSIFANTTYFSFALLGRFVAGIGGTFGLMGAMFVVSQWAPKRFLALALGVTITIGLSAGLLEGPLTFLVHHFDWRYAMNLLALIALCIAIIMFFILQDNKSTSLSSPHQTLSSQHQTLSSQHQTLSSQRRLGSSNLNSLDPSLRWDDNEVRPDGSEAKPDNNEAKPDDNEARPNGSEAKPDDNEATLTGNETLKLFKNKQNWLIALFGGLMYIPTGTLGVLWGVNYLQAYYPSIPQSLAATMNSMIFLGWIIGSPLAGFLSDLFKSRKIFLIISSVCCFILLIIMTYITSIPVEVMFVLILFVGIFSSFSGLTFVMGVERNPSHSGMIIGFINMIAIIPSIIVSPLFGKVLDTFWQGSSLHGVRIYSLQAYQQGMLLEYGFVAVAFFLALALLRLR